LGGENLIFIMLIKNKVKPTKEVIAKANKITEKLSKEGVKVVSHYWTLGRYDDVVTIEAPDEKAAMKVAMIISDLVKSETLVAIPRNEGIKLLE
jgi:uncharacterized protein with GYD domain